MLLRPYIILRSTRSVGGRGDVGSVLLVLALELMPTHHVVPVSDIVMIKFHFQIADDEGE
jgi:hypothetical protein